MEEFDVEEIYPTSIQDSNNSDTIDDETTIFLPLGVTIKNIYPNPFIDKINLEISVKKMESFNSTLSIF